MNAEAKQNLTGEELPDRKDIQRGRITLKKMQEALDVLNGLEERAMPDDSYLEEAALHRTKAAEELAEGISFLAQKLRTEVKMALSVHGQIVPLAQEIASLLESSQKSDTEYLDMTVVANKIAELFKLAERLIPRDRSHNGSVSPEEHKALVSLYGGGLAINVTGDIEEGLERIKNYLAIAENF